MLLNFVWVFNACVNQSTDLLICVLYKLIIFSFTVVVLFLNKFLVVIIVLRHFHIKHKVIHERDALIHILTFNTFLRNRESIMGHNYFGRVVLLSVCPQMLISPVNLHYLSNLLIIHNVV